MCTAKANQLHSLKNKIDLEGKGERESLTIIDI